MDLLSLPKAYLYLPLLGAPDQPERPGEQDSSSARFSSMRRESWTHFHGVSCDGKVFGSPICEIEGKSQLVLCQKHCQPATTRVNCADSSQNFYQTWSDEKKVLLFFAKETRHNFSAALPYPGCKSCTFVVYFRSKNLKNSQTPTGTQKLWPVGRGWQHLKKKVSDDIVRGECQWPGATWNSE